MENANRGLPTVGSIVWSLNNGHDSSLNQFNIETGESRNVEIEKIKNEKHAFWDRHLTEAQTYDQVDKWLNDLIGFHGWSFPDHFVSKTTVSNSSSAYFGNGVIFHVMRKWLSINARRWDIKKPTVGYMATAGEIPHHAMHALSAYHCSPFKNAFAVSTDGLGDGTYYGESCFKNNQLVEYYEPALVDPTAFFQSKREDSFCGCAQPFRQVGFCLPHHITPHRMIAETIDTLDYAGKLMGLSSIVQNPNRKLVEHYKKLILSVEDFDKWCIGEHGDQGDYHLHPNKALGDGKVMHGRMGKQRKQIFTPEEELEHASALQTATNEATLEHFTSKHIRDKIVEHDNNLVLCGGGALNVVANQYLRENTDYNIFIPPDPGDSGLSFGLSCWYAMQRGWKGYDPDNRPPRRFSQLNFITKGMEKRESETVTIEEVSDILKSGKIIGLIQGQIENGPRALGNRSILCDPSFPDMRDRINAKIKNREWYRPFAPVCRLEDAPKFFESRSFDNLEHMSFTVDVRPEYRETFPSITHVDNTARLQTVTEKSNPFLYDLLSIEKSVLLNTSFNVQGYPILNTWEDALKILDHTDLHYVLYKDEDGKLNLYK